MAAWFTIYCTRSVSHVTATDITSALNAMDFYTLAEGFNIDDEEVVDKALSQLQVKPSSDRESWFEIRYRAPKLRPLIVHLWTSPDRVREELTESLAEYLASRKGQGAARVRSLLSEVVEVAAVELGIWQLEDMGLVIGGQIAEYLAGVGAGVIRDTGDEWWVMKQGVPKLLLGRA
jgi:hypothetical protein